MSANNTGGPFQEAQFQVTNNNPVWVFCRQSNHCQLGMVFAINPGNKFAAFQAAAMGNTTSVTGSSSSPAALATTSSTSPVVSTATTPVPSSTPTPVPSSTPTSTTSQDHKIVVGGAGLLTFQPANITAQPGDTITFEFHQKNHTATQSSFAAPCRMLASTSTNGQVGFDSGLYVVVHSTRMPHVG